ncbi:Acg family FMN-binding oxidoreductase [Pseudonocardia ailaonensis]|uniref:Acg family FMN-binding oxidoreductase n=1 Tax=Pseudonocardia ailaonensis TaxID=367279 RepID=UPI0031D3B5C9
MDSRLPERAVELALRAPSVHNSQPWIFRIGSGEVQLYADPGRHLPGTDPDRRDLLLSCGAVLHHLAVAAAGLGSAIRIERMPDPEDSRHLATVRFVDGPLDRTAAVLFGQLGRRHTDRRSFTDEPIPPARLAALVRRARAHGVSALPVVEPRVLAGVAEVLAAAADEQRHEPGYLAELLQWTHRYADGRDGVPVGAVPSSATRPGERHLLRFPSGSLPGRATDGPDGGTLLVLVTPGDLTVDRLVAGEAASDVLLTSTRAGLATAVLSQAVELSTSRERLRKALGTAEDPQLVLRIGTPLAGASPVPDTPRRPLRSVLLR